MPESLTIGGYNTWDDFGLRLLPFSVPQAEIKSQKVTIWGHDGDIDLTAIDGIVTYNNRIFSVTGKKTLTEGETELSLSRSLASALHGYKGQIRISHDPGRHLVGRVAVGPVDVWGVLATVSFALDCEPYFYKDALTTVEQAVTGSAEISLLNEDMPVVPSVTVSAEMTLAWSIGGVEYEKTLSAGTWTIADLVLRKGQTAVTVSGTGTILFQYREGSL